jgi:hypothetical protein
MSRGQHERTESDSDRSESTDAGGPPSTNDDANIGLDEIFGVLKNRRRRGVLRYLSENSEQLDLGTLAEQIAARECGKDVSQITSQERTRVYVGLYQCHLPKMADTGAISYNRSRGRIEPGPNFGLFDRYLPDDENPAEQPNATSWRRHVANFIS